jgi:GNAT superfamily N-acetyltransferase
VLRLCEDVSFLVEDLFRATFDGQRPPAEPMHYVAFHRDAEALFRVAGYYHVTRAEEYALVGGLCVDPAFRRLGIGERLEHTAFSHPEGAWAFFAHVGDPRRAHARGFVDTTFPHLVVKWMETVSPPEQARLIEKVARLGPF